MINCRQVVANNPLSLLSICVVIAVIYYGTAQLSLSLAFQQTNATPVWPPSGIAFAALILFGKRVWPGIFAGASIANFGTFLSSEAFSIPSTIALSTIIGTGNTLEAVVGLWLLHSLTGKEDLPRDVHGILLFIVTVALMCVVSSMVGASTLLVSGIVEKSLIPNIWFTWWLGDAVGILTVFPFLVMWAKFKIGDTDAHWWKTFIILILLTGIVSACVFGEWMIPAFVAHFPYLVIPLMFWSAFRFGLFGGANSIFIVSAIAIIGTVNGLGGFSVESTHTSLLLLQTFIFIIASTTLLVATAIEERNQSAIALQKINRRLQQQKTELELSNQELEAFSYSISHDLRSPLRTIDGFSNAILEDFGENLNEEARKNLNRVQAAAQRMRAMINDLLQFSKVNQMGLDRRRIDITKLAENILRKLKEQDKKRNITLQYSSPVYANVDPVLFRIVLENLIGNAWKFTSTKAEAYIEIGERYENGTSIFYIKDNGIGFDMANAQKLFYVFQRLHNNQIEGTGVGLAIVARIIKRHGGIIRGEGHVGEGAEFSFTISSED